MTGQALRAWHFDLPLSAVASEGGPRPGGLRLTATGAIRLTDEVGAVRQALLLLLSTRPGERLMRPDYGCHLHRLVFAPNDAGTAGLAIHYVREAVRRCEPRIAIQRLDAGADLVDQADASRLDIILDYRIRHLGQDDQLSLNYDLAGGRLSPNPGAIGAATG
jgi:phage baseplate assembly protein W